MTRKPFSTDMKSGLFFAVVGVFAVWRGLDYDMGTAARMGPGYFPVVLGGVLALLGLAILGRGLLEPGEEEPQDRFEVKSFVLITLAVVGFAAALIVFYPVWLLRLMGAADVKLMAVLGLALGWKEAGMVVLFGTVLAGLHALVLVLIPSLERKYGFALPGTRVKARSVPLGAWLSLATMGWVWIQNQ